MTGIDHPVGDAERPARAGRSATGDVPADSQHPGTGREATPGAAPRAATTTKPGAAVPGTNEDETVVEGEVVEDAVGEATVAADILEGDLSEVVAEARRQRDEYLDALRRVQADFENYRKRVQRQQDELVARAAERLVVALLPALDAFDLAEAHLAGDDSLSPGGLLQAAALLRDTLEKEGLEKVAVVGDGFDPNAHEAVDHIEAEGDSGGPVVDAVYRPGYRWKGRVVRAAMVKVRG